MAYQCLNWISETNVYIVSNDGTKVFANNIALSLFSEFLRSMLLDLYYHDEVYGITVDASTEEILCLSELLTLGYSEFSVDKDKLIALVKNLGISIPESVFGPTNDLSEKDESDVVSQNGDENPCHETLCVQCGKMFKKSYLRLHIKRVHSNGITKSKEKKDDCWKCEICKKSVKKKNCKRHAATHDQASVSTKFVCKQCCKEFSNLFNLTRHTEAVHDMVRYVCPYCSKEYLYKQKLNIHVSKCKIKNL